MDDDYHVVLHRGGCRFTALDMVMVRLLLGIAIYYLMIIIELASVSGDFSIVNLPNPTQLLPNLLHLKALLTGRCNSPIILPYLQHLCRLSGSPSSWCSGNGFERPKAIPGSAQYSILCEQDHKTVERFIDQFMRKARICKTFNPR